MRTHISRRDLRRYGSDESEPSTKHARHLATCATCAGRLEWYRALRRTSSELPELGPPKLAAPTPSRPGDAASDPRRRGAAATVNRRGARYFLPRAAVLALAAIPVLLIWRGERLSARSSELRFAERRVPAGDSARVRYSPSIALATEDSVVVRGRFRGADDRRYDATLEARPAGVLRRTADGDFVGSVNIPAGAVYGVLAVESAGADRVDTNFGRLFDVRIEDDANGHLALQQKVNDLLSRNWEMAVQVQHEIAAAFPEDPSAWEQLLALEQEIVPVDRLDSLRAAHMTRRDELARTVQASDAASADDAAALLWYSILLGDPAGQSLWKQALLAADPTHPRSVEQRAYAIVIGGGGDSTVLAGLEDLWQEVGPAHRFLPEAGIQAALRLEDPGLITLWGGRYLTTRPDANRWLARQFLRFPELRLEGLRRLQAALDRAGDDGRRPLDLDREAFLASTATYRSDLHFEIASGLLEGGTVDLAASHLRQAIELDWNPAAYRALARIQVLESERRQALESLARVAADPFTDFSADSAGAVIGEIIDPGAWSDAVAAAESEMSRRVADRSESAPLPLGATLRSEDGREAELGALVDGSPTVIAYWSPYCGPALEILPEVGRMAERLEDRGARLLLVTTEPRSGRVTEALRARGVEVPTWFDEDRTLMRALEQFGTPSFYVIDAAGDLRFRRTALERIEREVVAIDLNPGSD